ncbi:MAG: bile acid:sodium symporter family protein [Cyclobacteriaceae bacterium]|nr:bile acid:sodium symporter family protein [Cyclobacteriaceae bacterium]UYN87623.1 MAG: bile acid:sodium symporter family protein [Cyclobacteriaceae bacterium]
MQANILTEIFLPVALGIIMLGMGLSLTLDDFKRIALFPKATFVGLVSQLVVLPVIAFGMLKLISLPPELAVGVMLLAFCPGGATSNLLSNLARADVALSITLTAISSMVTVFTIPFFVNLSMEHFIGEGKYVELPVLKTMLQIVVITIIPVSIGMLLRWKSPKASKRAEKPVKIASALFITIIILGAILKERANLADFFAQVGVITLLINLVILTVAYGISKLLNLSHPQRSAIAIESGIQNGTLAIAIATSSMLLNNSQMSIPAAIYSLIMFVTGGIAVYFFSRTFMFDKA